MNRPIVHQIRDLQDRIEERSAFGMVAKFLARAYSSGSTAVELAEAAHAPARVVQGLKAAVGAAGPTDPAWGNQLAAGGGVVSGFIELLRARSVFYRMYEDGALVRLPAQTRAGIISVGATGWIVGAGQPVPLSKLDLAGQALEEKKAAAIVVATRELLDASNAENILTRELRGAVSEAVDLEFLTSIMDTSSPPSTPTTASSGTTDAAMRADLRTLLAAVNTTGAGRLYWVMAPDVANRASLIDDGRGGMTPTGGEMLGLPALVSSQVEAGVLYLIDASGIAADRGTITLAASNSATLEMLDENLQQNALTGAGVNLVSLFQTNAMALKAVAYFAAERYRSNAVAKMTGITWGDA